MNKDEYEILIAFNFWCGVAYKLAILLALVVIAIKI